MISKWGNKKPDEWYDENRWLNKGKLPSEKIEITKITVQDYLNETDLVMCFKIGTDPKEAFNLITYRNGERIW